MLAPRLRLGDALLGIDHVVMPHDRPERHEDAETDSHVEDQRERQQAHVEAVVRHRVGVGVGCPLPLPRQVNKTEASMAARGCRVP
eukprot:5492090-Pyramimonas_sp.AAC.1